MGRSDIPAPTGPTGHEVLPLRSDMPHCWPPAYSSKIQQPVHTTADLGKHPRARQAAPSDREQHRAGGWHPDGLIRLSGVPEIARL